MLMAVALQMALVPLLQLYSGGARLSLFGTSFVIFPDLDLNNRPIAVWLAHTGFGLPLAIYLLHKDRPGVTWFTRQPTAVAQSVLGRGTGCGGGGGNEIQAERASQRHERRRGRVRRAHGEQPSHGFRGQARLPSELRFRPSELHTALIERSDQGIDGGGPGRGV